MSANRRDSRALRHHFRATLTAAWLCAGVLALACSSSEPSTPSTTTTLGGGGTLGGDVCPMGLAACGSCVDLSQNPAHCGACNVACAAGQQCVTGVCQCLPGQSQCGAGCVATASDAFNCGACGNACAADQVCSQGTCAATCAVGLTQCGQSCADVLSNPAHCGACNVACAAGQVCSAGACGCPSVGQIACAPSGACIDPQTDPANCGACGQSCGAGQSCSLGVCSGSTAASSTSTNTTATGATATGASTGDATTAGATGATTTSTSSVGGTTSESSATSSTSDGTGGATSTGTETSSSSTSGGLGGMAGAGNPADVVAFPGAEGFGKDALGGRGGSVCHVTTLADAGAGSLRDCVSQSNRTVVFDVGGWITLASNLGVTGSNITIAGQTAPGAGIGIRGRKFSIGGQHIVARYLRVRRGIMVTTDRDDAMTVSSDAANVILDHISVSYGTDETLSMPGDQGIGPRNLTVQWSIIAWGLQRNNHSAGSLFCSNQTTIHHTLWAFNKTRNPRARSELSADRGLGGHLDWVNNVIYGWNAQDPVGEAAGWSLSYDPFILAGTTNGQHAANAVGNYFISRRSASYAFHNGTSNFSLYFSDNLLDGNANGTLDTSKTGTDMIQGTPTLLGQRIAGPLVTTDTPAVAYQRVMADVGSSFPARDQADALLISQVESQQGILIQSEQDLVSLGVGDSGYSVLENASRPGGFDADQDGLADAWELENGLSPSDANDRNGDADNDGYTNLEEYLNALVR